MFWTARRTLAWWAGPEGRAQASGGRLEDVTAAALANQSIKEFVHPEGIGALAVFLSSDSALPGLRPDVPDRWRLAVLPVIPVQFAGALELGRRHP
jgi:hypothetical protein